MLNNNLIFEVSKRTIMNYILITLVLILIAKKSDKEDKEEMFYKRYGFKKN